MILNNIPEKQLPATRDSFLRAGLDTRLLGIVPRQQHGVPAPGPDDGEFVEFWSQLVEDYLDLEALSSEPTQGQDLPSAPSQALNHIFSPLVHLKATKIRSSRSSFADLHASEAPPPPALVPARPSRLEVAAAASPPVRIGSPIHSLDLVTSPNAVGPVSGGQLASLDPCATELVIALGLGESVSASAPLPSSRHDGLGFSSVLLQGIGSRRSRMPARRRCKRGGRCWGPGTQSAGGACPGRRPWG